MWIWVLAIATIWILGAVIFEAHAWYIKKTDVHRWRQRQQGLISFTNRQYQVMRMVWPLTAFVMMLAMFLISLSRFLSFVISSFRNDSEHIYPDLNIMTSKIVIDREALIVLAEEVGEPTENPVHRFDSEMDAKMWMVRLGEFFRRSIAATVICDDEGLVYFEQVAQIVSQFTDIDLRAYIVTRSGEPYIEVEMVDSKPILSVTVHGHYRMKPNSV